MSRVIVLFHTTTSLDVLLNVLRDYAPLLCWLVLWGLVYVAYAKRAS